jgi:hypothetical protein
MLPGMRDMFDPSEAELEAWARTPGAMYPTEDWDIIIANDERAPVFLRLAADSTCANSDAFLNFLYVYAGGVVRAGKEADSEAALQRLISAAMSLGQDELHRWGVRATSLLQGKGPDPRPFGARADYEFWFMCGWRDATE